MKALQKTLGELGLSEMTAKVYLALLGQKRATARQLAEVVGIPRPSVYDHTKELYLKRLHQTPDPKFWP